MKLCYQISNTHNFFNTFENSCMQNAVLKGNFEFYFDAKNNELFKFRNWIVNFNFLHGLFWPDEMQGLITEAHTSVIRFVLDCGTRQFLFASRDTRAKQRAEATFVNLRYHAVYSRLWIQYFWRPSAAFFVTHSQQSGGAQQSPADQRDVCPRIKIFSASYYDV